MPRWATCSARDLDACESSGLARTPYLSGYEQSISMPAPPKPSRLVQLSALAVTDDGPLPDAFRLFEQGVNESSKGPCIFDAAAAAHVFEAYRRTGGDYVIDLEHLSHDEVARLTREDATDARGWFQIELRNGELWAVNVRWTPDGE